MLIVTSLAGEKEALTDLQGAEVNEEVNGDFSLRFTTFASERNSHSYDLLQEESVIELDGHEFRVKSLAEERKRKTVYAQHVFFDLIDHQVYDINGGTKTLNEFASIALTGTGWTFESVDVSESKLIPNFGEDNALALIRLICEVYQCEVKIEPDRHLKFVKEMGEDNDEQFRYGHNIKTLKRSVDTDKLATVIKGYGGDGLEVTYTSPNEAIYGVRHAEPVRDERFTIPESMIERLKQEIVDVPEVSIELETVQLGFDVSLGDKVWTIYEPMNIEFQQRAMVIKRFPFTKKSPIITLSNKKKSFPDLLTETRIEVKENAKQTRSEITQTNEKIELKVSQTDYNGMTITSLISQDALSISLLAQNLNLEGLVTFTNLSTPGATVIDGGNILAETINAAELYGNLFSVGNGVTNSRLEIHTDDENYHYIQSTRGGNEINGGLRILVPNGPLSLVPNPGTGVYVSGAPLVANGGLRVNGIAQFNNGMTVSGTATIANLNVTSSDITVFNGPIYGYDFIHAYNFTASGAMDAGLSSNYGYFRYGGDTSNYFRVGSGSAHVYVNGVSKASWASLPKVSVEPSGDGILDGNEFGVNNGGSMQPTLTDFFRNVEVNGERVINLDENFLKFVGEYDVFFSAGSSDITLKEKHEDHIVLQGTGTTSLYVIGVQRGKENIVGYSFKEFEDEMGQTMRDFEERRINR